MFTYDINGTPMTVSENGTVYYYVTNLQGDVVAILDSSGSSVVQYAYDAWGKLLGTTGTMATTLGTRNPLRYRGYVYDQETGLDYLQSRYYNPTLGRFLNADAFTSTGQGISGNNMFAYCGSSPVMYSDPTGHFMAYMDFLNRAGGPSGVTSVDSGGGGYSTSYAVAQSGSSANNKVPSFSPGKRDPLELWDEIKDDIISIVKAEDILAEQYPEMKLHQGGKDIYSGIGHIRKGLGILIVPDPTPLNDLKGVGCCVYGILEAAGGLVKSIIAVDRL